MEHISHTQSLWLMESTSSFKIWSLEQRALACAGKLDRGLVMAHIRVANLLNPSIPRWEKSWRTVAATFPKHIVSAENLQPMSHSCDFAWQNRCLRERYLLAGARANVGMKAPIQGINEDSTLPSFNTEHWWYLCVWKPRLSDEPCGMVHNLLDHLDWFYTPSARRSQA